eukprot:TRINITY_DN1882_c0_g1_i3.p1 TRINITY_DN1882_c0_g1~~TRINITY_DN1882_c0_g1_i3.p1  ORF type:complete len:132 (-),score=28.22 TRINITY_DN1882_c0_g1_i3:146-520(-)
MNQGRYIQDGPPASGFGRINYRRMLASSRGPSGIQMFLGVAAMFAFGMVQVNRYHKEREAVAAERLEARMAIMPVLQAEEDQRYVAARQEQLEKERKIMAGVPGYTEEPFYKTRWMPPAKPMVG